MKKNLKKVGLFVIMMFALVMVGCGSKQEDKKYTKTQLEEMYQTGYKLESGGITKHTPYPEDISLNNSRIKQSKATGNELIEPVNIKTQGSTNGVGNVYFTKDGLYVVTYKDGEPVCYDVMDCISRTKIFNLYEFDTKDFIVDADDVLIVDTSDDTQTLAFKYYVQDSGPYAGVFTVVEDGIYMAVIGISPNDNEAFDPLTISAFYSEGNNVVLKQDGVTYEYEIMIRNGKMFTRSRSY
jgi:lipoprotein